MSVLRPDLMMKCVVPVIMAGIIAVSIFTPENALPSHVLTPPPPHADLRSRRRCPHFQRTYVFPSLGPSLILLT